jgi:phospholipase A-2-activating protein
MYKLSTTLHGHEDDVKTLVALDDNTIVSGSRDSTVRVWHRSNFNSKDFSTSVINYKAHKFINALAIYDSGNQKLIASAGNDNLINLTSPNAVFTDVNVDEYCLVGHTANICTLDTLDNLIISGSWDCTAKVWDKNTGEVLYDLKGHENSVWCAKFLNQHEFLTCSADRTIRKWNRNKEIKRFIAHEDVVRDLLILPNGDFVSCSNDSTIKIWDGITFKNKGILSGHQSFIYSLALTSTGDIISCGEDRSVRIWRNFECIQVITLPCISIWKVIVLNNDDIVTASSDSIIRIFSRDEERFAKENELLVFKKELEDSTVSESSFNNINKNTIPGIEALNSNETKIEGETRLIKSAHNTIELYQWTENQWLKIGQMVEGTASSNQKQFYNGSYYDYVFNIDIEDGKPPLKLPVNISDNPYDVAEKFLATYNLPYSYLQEIVNFIMKNAEGITIDSSSNTNKPKGILPQTKYLSFEKMDIQKLVSAFKKLNDNQTIDNQITENLEILLLCEDYDKINKIALKIIENWDNNSKLLGFDILRSVITKVQPSEELFPIIRTGLDLKDLSVKVQMMTIRVLVNTFSAKSWGEQVMIDEDIFDIIFTDYLFENLLKDSNFLPITVSTLILNYSVLINKFQLIKFQDKILPIIIKLLNIANIINNNECSYRLLVSIGTLNYMKTIIDKVSFLSPFSKIKDERIEKLIKEIQEN